MIISFVSCLHPTEGLLARATLFSGAPNEWVQGWRRCVDLQGNPITAADAVTQGWDMAGIELRDDGTVEVPDLRVDVTGTFEETSGSIDDDGIRIDWGGACPVQGSGSVSGHTLYYRARGSGWSVDIDEGLPGEFNYGEDGYIWPDGGWLNAAESERNIRIGVAKWREFLTGGGEPWMATDYLRYPKGAL